MSFKLQNINEYVFCHKRIAIFIVVSFVAFGFGLFLVQQKFEENGICWKSLSKLGNEELYNQAMRSYVGHLLITKKQQNDKFDMDWGSEVWQLPSMSEGEIKTKLLSIKIKSPNNVKTILGYKILLDLSELGKVRVRENAFSIAHNLPGYHVYMARDCCKIFTVKDIQDLKRQFKGTRPSWESGLLDWKAPTNPTMRYLGLREMRVLSLQSAEAYPDQDMVIRGGFKLEKNFLTDSFIRLNACGCVVIPKPNFTD